MGSQSSIFWSRLCMVLINHFVLVDLSLPGRRNCVGGQAAVLLSATDFSLLNGKKFTLK